MDTAKQLNLSKSGLPLKLSTLVNKEQEMRTSRTTRMPSEMLKLKGNKPGPILSGRSSHNRAQNPSAVGLPFHRTCLFLLSSVQGPHTSDLCFQSLTTSLRPSCQCLCVHVLILIERTTNSKIKIKIKMGIATCTPKCKLSIP